MLQDLVPQGDGQIVHQLLFVDAAEELVVVVLEELPDLEVKVLWKVCFDAELLQSF